MAYFSARGIGSVELTDERKSHILKRHPEVKRHLHRLARTLADPETVRRSRHDPEALIFYQKASKEYYLAVVVKINRRKYILTAYLTDRIAHPTII